MKRILLMTAILGAGVCRADGVRMPCRFVETSYTVHTLTGATSNEQQKYRVLSVFVDIAKKTPAGAEAQISFQPRPTQNEDKTDIVVENYPYAKKAELLAAIARGKAELQKMRTKKEDIEVELLAEGEFKLTACVGKKNYVLMRWSSDTKFELQVNHLQQMTDLIKKL